MRAVLLGTNGWNRRWPSHAAEGPSRTCVSSGVRDVLTEAGHDVVWVGDFVPDPGDEAIIATAFGQGRILVTLDKDFGELAIVRGQDAAQPWRPTANRESQRISIQKSKVSGCGSG